MLKKNITYKYKDDDEVWQEVTKAFWFNISDIEIVRLNAEYEDDGGIAGMIKAIQDGKKKNKEIVAFFEFIVSSSYGIKDGEDFEKDDKIRKKFMNHPAYNALIMEMITNANSAEFVATFLAGVLPHNFATDEEAAKAVVEAKAKADAEAKDTATTP